MHGTLCALHLGCRSPTVHYRISTPDILLHHDMHRKMIYSSLDPAAPATYRACTAQRLHYHRFAWDQKGVMSVRCAGKSATLRLLFGLCNVIHCMDAHYAALLVLRCSHKCTASSTPCRILHPTAYHSTQLVLYAASCKGLYPVLAPSCICTAHAPHTRAALTPVCMHGDRGGGDALPRGQPSTASMACALSAAGTLGGSTPHHVLHTLHTQCKRLLAVASYLHPTTSSIYIQAHAKQLGQQLPYMRPSRRRV
jgi:hypothetical protein